MHPAVTRRLSGMALLLVLAPLAAVPLPLTEAAWPTVEASPPHWAYHNWTFGDYAGYTVLNVTFPLGTAQLENTTMAGWVLSPAADLGRLANAGEATITWTVDVQGGAGFAMTVAGTVGNTSGEWSNVTWVPAANGSAVPTGFRYYAWNATMSGTFPGETPVLRLVTLTAFQNAGPAVQVPAAFSAYRNTWIALNSTGTTDADGDTLAYQWRQVSGPAVSLLNASTPETAFLPQANGTYVIELNVTDGWGFSTASVSVSVTNAVPTADAGPPQTAVRNATVVLNATASLDPNGDALLFLWSQVSGPDLVPITTPDQAIASVVPTGVGTYVFSVAVQDNESGLDTASVSVDVLNQAPAGNAGADAVGFKNGLAVLDGTASSDPDGDPLTYAWVQLTGPPVVLLNGTAALASFLVPTGPGASGLYVFELNVTDGFGVFAVDTVAVTVTNRLPGASAGPDQFIPAQGVRVLLDATGSLDVDGEPIVGYLWTQMSGTPVAVNNATAAVADFAAAAGTYGFQVDVTDPEGANATDTVLVTVANAAPVAALAVNPPVKAGRPTEVNASTSFDPDGSLVEYAFAFGDGTNSTGPSAVVNHVWSAPGLYVVNVTVRDDSGTTANATTSVNVVPNALPFASAMVIPGSGNLSTIFLFDSSASLDPDGTILNWTWDFGDGAFGYGPVVGHAFAARASFAGLLTVTDEDAGMDSAPFLVEVLNRAPTADAGPDRTGAKYTPIALGVAASDDDGDVLAYAWAQSAGPSVPLAGAATASPSFTPTVAGLYVFQVRANDSFGGNATDSVAVTVPNTAPSASAGADQSVPQDAAVLLDGSGSEDPDGDALGYRWTQVAGPAVSLLNATLAAARFTTSTPGAYAFLLEVDDGDGGVGNDSVAVTVLNVLPLAALAAIPPAAVLGDPVTLDGSASSDPDGTIAEYAFDFGDGNLTAGLASSVSHTYGTPGAYTVTLLVMDNDGGTSLDQASVIVTPPPFVNGPPVAAMAPVPLRGNLSTTFSFDASPSTDPDGDPLTATWDFGDGTAANGTAVAHVYARRGPFTVTLRVDDGRGGNDTATIALLIDNRAPSVRVGPGRRATVGETLQITADATDPDGDLLAYRWRLIDGPAAVLSGESNGTAGLLLREAGQYTLQVTVDDGFGGADTATVTVTAEPAWFGWPWFLGALFAAALASWIFGYEPTRVAVITIFLGALYSRRLREDPDLEVRGMIQGYLKAHPGDTFADIKRILDLNNGAVAWHLQKLEKEDMIKSQVRDGRRRYYPREIALPLENGGELYEVQRRLIRAVVQDPGLEVSLIAEKLGMSRQLTLYHLRKLAGKGYVNLERRALRLSAFPGEKQAHPPQNAK